MAHKLNKINGTWSFASHAEPAWHGLGQVVNKAMTAKEAIQLANMDFEVVKSPIYYKVGNQYQDIPNHFATIRTDTKDQLGLVKSKYEIIQNKDAFAFFDAIIDEGEAIYETAGVLGKGERIFLLAKLPEDFRIGGEKIDKYIMLTTSHDGSSSVVAGLTNIRVVCNNTLQAAMKGLDNKISITHTEGAKDRLAEAHRVMKIASIYTQQIGESFNRMTDVKMTEGDYRAFFEQVFKSDYITTEANSEKVSTRLKNMVDSTTEFALTHPTQTTPEASHTLWGAYNAVSGYYNYIQSYENPEKKFHSQFFGYAEKKMLKAFNQALERI
jgi:phage/plasmid-like protein (TIGR03299 family)